MSTRSKPALPEVLTLIEAAALLRVDANELRQTADAGRIPGRLIGKEWRFMKSALVEWLSTATHSESDGSGPFIRKAFTTDPNAGFLAAIGAFADDQTLDAMTEEIYKERKKYPVGD